MLFTNKTQSPESNMHLQEERCYIFLLITVRKELPQFLKSVVAKTKRHYFLILGQKKYEA